MSYIGDWKDYFKNRDFVHQIGFYAPDWKHFALKHHELFGSGPFYYTTNTFGRLIYRGKEVDAGSLKFPIRWRWYSRNRWIHQRCSRTGTI